MEVLTCVSTKPEPCTQFVDPLLTNSQPNVAPSAAMFWRYFIFMLTSQLRNADDKDMQTQKEHMT